MNKIATDIEQSRKLAKVLPRETADMVYQSVDDDESFDGTWELLPASHPLNIGYKDDVPAWSLSALMDILPNKIEYECKTYFFKLQTDVYSSGEKYYDLGYQGCCHWLEYEDSKDLLDACVNMIVKLNEKKLL